MTPLAGYQAFCWIAIAFMTLGGTTTAAAAAVVGLGLASTLAAAALHRAVRRRLSARRAP